MRYLLIFLLVFFSCGTLSSQKKYSKKKIRKHYLRVYESKLKGTIVLSLDTIFNKGKPYAVLKKKKQLPYNFFGLYSLHNDELILIQTMVSINRDKTQYYAFMFVESDETAEPEKYYGYNIAEEIVKNNLVNNNKIDPFNETKFLLKYPRKFSDTTIKTYINDQPDEKKINTDNIYETVKRNRESEFYFNEGKIMQDYKIIGRYKILDTTMRFYLPSGIQVAEANEKGNTQNTWNVWSLKDSKTGIVQTQQNSVVKDLISYLLKNLYL